MCIRDRILARSFCFLLSAILSLITSSAASFHLKILDWGEAENRKKEKESHAYYKKEAGGDPCVQQV